MTRSFAGIAAGVVLLVVHAVVAQTTDDFAPATTNALPALVEPSAGEWSFSVSVAGYFVPDDRDYAQPTFTADRDWLHLEARYNYEALETGSAWIGYNFSFGEEVTLELTPMAGVIFGDLRGVAPGYEATLSWWKFELYTEGEFVFDTDDSSGNFFYSWSELSFAPADEFRIGLVAQRTKAYETNFDIQRGFLVGFSFKRVDFTMYIFNPDDEPTIVLSLGFNF